MGEEYTASLSLMGPNPFRSELALLYTVPSPGAVVTLELYDITGRLVMSVVDRFHDGGAYQVVWNGKDGRGHAVASGVYFCRTSIGEWGDARKLVLIR